MASPFLAGIAGFEPAKMPESKSGALPLGYIPIFSYDQHCTTISRYCQEQISVFWPSRQKYCSLTILSAKIHFIHTKAVVKFAKICYNREDRKTKVEESLPMKTISEWKYIIQSGELDARLAPLYGAVLPEKKARLLRLVDAFGAKYGEGRQAMLFSVPGRSELPTLSFLLCTPGNASLVKVVYRYLDSYAVTGQYSDIVHS